jgi:hypothetical protein
MTLYIDGVRVVVSTATAIQIRDQITEELPGSIERTLTYGYDRDDVEDARPLPAGVFGFAPTDHPGRAR